MKICQHCGAQNPEDNNFCSRCGKRLESVVMPVDPPIEEHRSGCCLIFKRPQNFQMMAYVFHVKVDNSAQYELRNGGEVKIPISPGNHSVEISVFGSPRRKQFAFQSNGDMTFICRPSPAAAITFWALPVKVTDSNGREY